MIDGKTVRCEDNECDSYGRLIARCSTEDVPDIGVKLVSAGLAWALVKYGEVCVACVEVGPSARSTISLRPRT